MSPSIVVNRWLLQSDGDDDNDEDDDNYNDDNDHDDNNEDDGNDHDDNDEEDDNHNDDNDEDDDDDELFRAGRVVAVVGASGGTKITTAVAQVFITNGYH